MMVLEQRFQNTESEWTERAQNDDGALCLSCGPLETGRVLSEVHRGPVSEMCRQDRERVGSCAKKGAEMRCLCCCFAARFSMNALF